MKLWEICLQENLDRETRSRIIGCQAQMKLFNGMHLNYKLYSITKASKYAFYESLIIKASKYEFINDPVLP